MSRDLVFFGGFLPALGLALAAWFYFFARAARQSYRCWRVRRDLKLLRDEFPGSDGTQRRWTEADDNDPRERSVMEHSLLTQRRMQLEALARSGERSR